MRVTRLNQIFGMLAVTATLCGAETAIAQNAAAPSSIKTIGTPSAPAKPEIVPSLFVLNSRGATLQGDTLTLTGVTSSSINWSVGASAPASDRANTLIPKEEPAPC